MGEFPEVPQHLAGLILQIGQLGGGELVTAEPDAGEPKTRDERHDLLLNSVMKVALDPTSLRVLRGNETDPRGGQLVESLLGLSREPNVGHCCRGLRGWWVSVVGVLVLCARFVAASRRHFASRLMSRTAQQLGELPPTVECLVSESPPNGGPVTHEVDCDQLGASGLGSMTALRDRFHGRSV